MGRAGRWVCEELSEDDGMGGRVSILKLSIAKAVSSSGGRMVGARCRGRCEVAGGNPDWVWPKCGAMQLMRCSLN